jgi:hypothetical protein
VAEAKNKKYEQDLLQKDQDITSLTHRLSLVDAALEKAERHVTESKVAQQEGEHSKSTNEGLIRKIQLLEEELDAAEKNVKETVEKCVAVLPGFHSQGLIQNIVCVRADFARWTSRQSTSSVRYSGLSKSGTSGRRNTRYGLLLSFASTCTHQSPVFQEAEGRYRQSKAELDELVHNMEGL